MLREELVDILNKGSSVIKCSFLTVIPKLTFTNGYLDQQAEVHVVVWCLDGEILNLLHP